VSAGVCGTTAMSRLTYSLKRRFFDASGNQLDNGLESQTVATHAQWPFFLAVPERFIHGFRCDVKVTRIIEVHVFGK